MSLEILFKLNVTEHTDPLALEQVLQWARRATGVHRGEGATLSQAANPPHAAGGQPELAADSGDEDFATDASVPLVETGAPAGEKKRGRGRPPKTDAAAPPALPLATPVVPVAAALPPVQLPSLPALPQYSVPQQVPSMVPQPAAMPQVPPALPETQDVLGGRPTLEQLRGFVTAVDERKLGDGFKILMKHGKFSVEQAYDTTKSPPGLAAQIIAECQAYLTQA